MAMTSDNLEIVIPANHVSGPKQGNWTYDHYAALPDDGHRYELVNGRYVLFGLFKQQEYLRSKVVPTISEVRVEQLFADI